MIYFVGIILLLHGIYTLYAAIKNKDMTFVAAPSDIYLIKKLLGQHHKPFLNLIVGIIEIILGILILFKKFS